MPVVSDRTRRIVQISSVAAFVVGLAGVVGLVSIGLTLALGEAWSPLNDAALLVLTAALAPLMLAFYELGGATPLRLAQAAQTLGWVAVGAWSAIQVGQMTGAVPRDPAAPDSGLGWVAAWALIYIGAWIAGANLLAGPWLTTPRPVGILAGLATAFFGGGLLTGGVTSAFTSAGALGYVTIVPLWAFLMARLLRTLGAGRQ
jgi:hypothetical protein